MVVTTGVAKAHMDAAVLGAALDAQPFDNQAEVHSVLAAAGLPVKPLPGQTVLYVSQVPCGGKINLFPSQNNMGGIMRRT